MCAIGHSVFRHCHRICMNGASAVDAEGYVSELEEVGVVLKLC